VLSSFFIVVAVRTSRLIGVEGDYPTLEFLNQKKISYLTPPKIVEDLRPYFAQLKPIKKFAEIIDRYKNTMPTRMIGFHVRKTDFPWHKPLKNENQRIAKIINHATTEYNNNDKKGTEHAIVDLYLLSQAQWIFGTVHSTFSVAAWLLSNNASLQGEWWIN